MEQSDDQEMQSLMRKAAIVLNPKIKRYKIEEVSQILNSDYEIDFPVTDT